MCITVTRLNTLHIAEFPPSENLIPVCHVIQPLPLSKPSWCECVIESFSSREEKKQNKLDAWKF